MTRTGDGLERQRGKGKSIKLKSYVQNLVWESHCLIELENLGVTQRREDVGSVLRGTLCAFSSLLSQSSRKQL